MKNLLAIFVAYGISTFSLYSQNKVIHGRIISEYLETMPGVSITINDSVEIGKTDLDGFFKIDIPISANKLLFKSVGLEPTAIEIGDNCGQVEIVMMSSGSYDFITVKKVNRLRKKKFKKLPELHKKAFEEKIFKTDKSCYLQDFICY